MQAHGKEVVFMGHNQVASMASVSRRMRITNFTQDANNHWSVSS